VIRLVRRDAERAVCRDDPGGANQDEAESDQEGVTFDDWSNVSIPERC